MKDSRAHNKRSLLSVGTLVLCLAALQGPLWRSTSAIGSIAVREGSAMLIDSDRDVAKADTNESGNATAEVVGNHQVLVRGKLRGTTQLAVVAKDGSTRLYRVSVRPQG